MFIPDCIIYSEVRPSPIITYYIVAMFDHSGDCDKWHYTNPEVWV